MEAEASGDSKAEASGLVDNARPPYSKMVNVTNNAGIALVPSESNNLQLCSDTNDTSKTAYMTHKELFLSS